MNPHENLDNLFEQARQTIPLLDKEDVQKIIVESIPVIKSKNILSTKTFIIGTAATIVICGAVYFIYPKEETPKQVIQHTTIAIDTSKEITNQSPKIIEETPLIISSEKKVTTTPSKNLEDLKVEKNNTVQTKTEESPIYPNVSIGTYPKRVDEEKVSNDGYLHLSNEELANLGIITNGNKLYYKNITDLDSMIIDNMTTGEKKGYKEMLPTFEIKIPISGGRSTMTSAYSKDSDLTVFKKFWPDVIEMKDQYDFITVTNKNTHHNYYREFGLDVKKILIPVLVPLYHPLGISSRYDTLIFYFKPTVSFFNSLPIDLISSAESIAKSYNNTAYNTLVNYYIQKDKTKTDSFNLAVKAIPNLSHQITLTKEELKKLNIEFDGKTLDYKNRFAINHQKIKLEIKNGGIVPSVYIDKHYRFFKAHKPQVFPYCTSDTLLNMANFYFKIDEDKRIPYVQLRDQFLTMIDSVVPVRIKYNSGYTQLFWFPKNETFIKKLSTENQEKVVQTKKVEKTIDISKIHLLELNETELHNFGVTAKTSSIKIPISWNNGQDYIEYSDKGSSATIHYITQKEYYDLPINERGDSVKISFGDDQEKKFHRVYFKKSLKQFIMPIMVTNETGKHAYMLNDNRRYELHDTDYEYMRKHEIDTTLYYQTKQYSDYAQKCVRSRMQTFVPIIAKTIDQQFKIILWYEPTDSFFAALPKNIADEIKSEYTAIKANQPTPSCKYFEVCQSVKGMINEYSVYPNPTNNEINVLIDLAEERKLTISLTDISGKIVKNFVKDLHQLKGKKEYSFQIGEVSEGMYLLLIESDKGERVTQRIIKK